MAGYFYAFATEGAAVAAGAMVEGDIGAAPSHAQAVVLRRTGIVLAEAVLDSAGEITTPAVMSAPLVILSPEPLAGCDEAVIEPPGHQGFA